MRRSATLMGMKASDRAAIDDGADYLLTYRPYLRYDEHLAAGLPIATGVIEGACRHLVKDRMDITGACWGLDSAEAVLKLRSLRVSSDFDAYWAFHETAEHARNHLDLYQGAPPPTNLPLKVRARGHLHIVNQPHSCRREEPHPNRLNPTIKRLARRNLERRVGIAGGGTIVADAREASQLTVRAGGLPLTD
jgi:hypothetical protein